MEPTETKLYFIKREHSHGTHLFAVDVGEKTVMVAAVVGKYTEERGEAIKNAFLQFLSLASGRELSSMLAILPDGQKVNVGHA